MNMNETPGRPRKKAFCRKPLVARVGDTRYELEPDELTPESAGAVAATLAAEPPGLVILTTRSAAGWSNKSAIGLCRLWAHLARSRKVMVNIGSKTCAGPLAVLFAVWKASDAGAERWRWAAEQFVARVIDPADHPAAAAAVAAELAPLGVTAADVLSGVAHWVGWLARIPGANPGPFLRLGSPDGEPERTSSVPLFEGEWWRPAGPNKQGEEVTG